VIVGATAIPFIGTTVESAVIVDTVVGAIKGARSGTALIVTLARFARATVGSIAATTGARDVGAIAAIPTFQLTAAILVVLAAPPAFIAATVQWAVVVVAVLSAGDRTFTVSATLAVVIASATKRDRGLSLGSFNATKRDQGRHGPA